MAIEGGEISIERLVQKSVVCMLRSEMHALVTINDVWNSEEVKKCLGEAFYFGFSMGRPV